MDWIEWMPRDRANLCFILKGDRVLLIRKKRGLGAGKINAPGGKLEPGETPLEAAVRETREEVGLTPLHLEERGLLRFQFTDGYSLACTVFVARDCEGEAVETEEATPYWIPVNAVPYGEMWADDAEWLPAILEGGTFTGSFVFDGERMLEKDVRFHGPFGAAGRTGTGAKTALVAGCGFVGLPLARQMHAAGWNVVGCTHSGDSARALAGEAFPVVACDIAEASEVEAVLGPWYGLDTVVHCASSGRGGEDAYRKVYLRGVQTLGGVLGARHVIFTSSTSVYAQTGGEWVDEHSGAEPDRETGRILRQTEEWVLGHGGAAARLAGIYGPGRSVLLRKFFSGEARIEGDGSRWINQIHRDDAAAALSVLADRRAWGIFNVGDDEPLNQRSLYTRLAERFQRPLPPEGEPDLNRKRGWTHKRVSNSRLRALGWKPRYASFFDALAQDPDLERLARV
jgi:mutator protein MutT